MNNDKELLELAAKAAGIEYWVVRFAPKSAPIEKLHITKDGETVEWNPLTDDGDALQLAVKLNLSIDTNWYNSDACWLTNKAVVSSFDSVEEEPHNGDPYAASRRAIVRAAAEIGKLK